MIKAVIFDLDDTLFMEDEYVKCAMRSVADMIEQRTGLLRVYDSLIALYIRNRYNVFDRFINQNDIKSINVNDMLYTYKNAEISQLPLNSGIEEILIKLSEMSIKCGIITDGNVRIQEEKINALGIRKYFDDVLVTDSLGGIEYRKPCEKAFRVMIGKFGVLPEETIYIGDNPEKDFAVKKYLPIITVRIKNRGSLYDKKNYLYNIKPDYVINRPRELFTIINSIGTVNRKRLSK